MEMEILYGSKDILEALCKSKVKAGLFLHLSSSEEELDVEEIRKAVPFLSVVQVRTLIFENPIFVFCETYEDVMTLYGQVIGDDGPTKTNLYNGPARVYALTCTKEGRLGTENT